MILKLSRLPRSCISSQGRFIECLATVVDCMDATSFAVTLVPVCLPSTADLNREMHWIALNP